MRYYVEPGASLAIVISNAFGRWDPGVSAVISGKNGHSPAEGVPHAREARRLPPERPRASLFGVRGEDMTSGVTAKSMAAAPTHPRSCV